jgi:hypothetical protein
MMHNTKHPLAGKTVALVGSIDPVQGQVVDGAEFRVEDYWDAVSGKSWMFSDGNPAALQYAMRSGMSGLPIDDEVVYGKIGYFGHLVHVSELGDEVTVS